MFLNRLWQDLRVRVQPSYERVQSGDEGGTPQPVAAWQQFIPRGRRRLVAICGLAFVLLLAVLLVSLNGPTGLSHRARKDMSAS